jgi:phenylalanyl-tRNA synthetase beta chain
MNISYSWLKEIIPDMKMKPEEVADHLASRGAPVDIKGGGEIGLGSVVVGRVNTVKKHPNADRLSICEVDNGKEVLQVICGAPLIKEGGHYPFAGVGSELPNGMKLKKAKIRGEFSNGMLCSEMELGLGIDQGGIMLLPESVSPGERLIEVLNLGEIVLEVEVTPNRGDWLSHLGLAREVISTGMENLQLPSIPGAVDLTVRTKTGQHKISDNGVSIRIDSPDLCDRFMGIVINDVTVGPSPDWLVKKLAAIGQQSINNIVDATNYVMLELGSPMHAYDLDKMEGGQIIVRNASEGEKIKALDGIEYNLTSEMLLVCDQFAPQNIAGVIGGMDSSVTEDTVNMFLECALFKPKSVRKTCKKLGIATDASYRFERGVDPEGHLGAIKRALEIILAIAGGEAGRSILEVGPKPYRASLLPLRLSRVESVLGLSFDADELQRMLSSIGFGIERSEKDSVVVNVPSYRSYDILREIDLIEEVARVYGYDQFPENLSPYLASSVPDHPLFELEEEVRKSFTDAGILEAINPAFANSREGDVELLNPISSEESHLRNSLLPGLLRNLESNFARSTRDIRLFEIGTVFRALVSSVGKEGREATNVGAVMTGSRTPHHWSTVKSDPIDFWVVKGIVGDALEVSGWKAVSLELGVKDSDLWVQGRAATIVCGGEDVGSFGQVLPERFEAPKWAGEVWALEFILPSRIAEKEELFFKSLPQHPGVDRDLALLLDLGVSSEDVISKIEEAGGQFLKEISIFDVYEGNEIPSRKLSLGIRMRFQSFERTLTDVEVELVVERIIRKLAEDLSVQQRL